MLSTVSSSYLLKQTVVLQLPQHHQHNEHQQEEQQRYLQRKLFYMNHSRVFREPSRSPSVQDTMECVAVDGAQQYPNLPFPPPPLDPIWLDILPGDVCERIAVHASSGGQTPHALVLGEHNAKLRQAVAAVLSYKMRFLETACPQARRWSNLLLPDIRDVEMKISSSALSDRRCLDDILRTRSLRRASIIDDVYPLRAIVASDTLRELHVRVQGYPREAGMARELLLRAFSSLNLEKLRLICCIEGAVTWCPFIDDNYLCPSLDDFPRCFHALRALDIDCARARIGDCDPTWRLFPALDSLQDLGFHGRLPEGQLRRVQSLETVRVKSGHDSFEIAMRIGAPVKEVHLKTAISSEQIKSLRNLPQLRILSLYLNHGDEHALLYLLERLPDLTSLDLHWGPSSLCFHGRDDVHTPCYAIPDDGITSRAIEKTRKLEELKLRDVRLKKDDLESILQHVGEKLRVFCTCVADQDETQLDRLEDLLYICAKNNPGLHEFRILDVYRRDGYDSRTQGRIQGSRIRRAMSRLQFCAPQLNTASIARAIAKGI